MGKKLCMGSKADELGIIEDARHIVMQCPFTQDLRDQMVDEISSTESGIARMVTGASGNIYKMVIGWCPTELSFEVMADNWCLLLMLCNTITDFGYQAIYVTYE